MKSLTKEQITEIIRTYKENQSLRKTCKKLNISIGTAHKYTTKNNIINKHNIPKKLNSTDERLIGLYIGLWMGDGTQYYDNGYTIKICSNKRNKLLNQFIIQSIYKLFGKKAALHNINNTNQAYIKYSSKFVFYFVYNYVKREENKTHSVRLKENIKICSREFLEGCLLGLSLSDGYLRRRFQFSVTSKKLAVNVSNMLIQFRFHPKIFIQSRRKYYWKDLHTVYLTISESRGLELVLDEIIKNLGCKYSFKQLKYEYGPDVI